MRVLQEVFIRSELLMTTLEAYATSFLHDILCSRRADDFNNLHIFVFTAL